MQRKALTVLIASIFMVLAVMPMAVADSVSAASDEVPKPYDPDSDDTWTFKGIVKYEGDYLTEEKLAGVHVVIVAAYRDPDDHRLHYTEMPAVGAVKSKEAMVGSEDRTNFSVTIPKLDTPLFGTSIFRYYLCVESGYKIDNPGNQLDSTPEKIYPYRYNSPDDAPWGHARMPTYIAYGITIPSGQSNPITITDTTDDSRHIITLMPAKVDVKGMVTSGKFALANVNIDFCRLTSPDDAEYTAISDKNGMFEIKDMNTGTYIVKVYTNGYTAEDQIYEVIDGDINTLDISMEQNASVYFGYDMPHFLLIIGGVIGIILILASLFFQYWVVKKKHDNWVYNDMKDKDEED